MVAIWLCLGGALGTLCRYYLGQAIAWLWPSSFPLGTLGINVLGSLLLGLLWAFRAKGLLATPLQAMLMVDFCGAFTTFSAFSMETVGLLQAGRYVQAGLYILASVALSLGAMVVGHRLGW